MSYLALLSGKKWPSETVTFSFLSDAPSYITDPNEMQTFAPVTSAMQTALISILRPASGGDSLRPAYFSDVSKLSFSQTFDDSGTIAIGSYERDEQEPAGAYFPDSADWGGDIWLDTDFITPAPYGSFEHLALIHEIGHAVGLEHGNVYPPTTNPTTLPNLPAQVDNQKYTVMSYNKDPDGGGTHPIGLQQFDIAALQHMYGANYNTRSDNTYYVFTPATGITTIWDGGGKDLIDTMPIDQRVIVDLQPGHFSSIGGNKNVAVALVSHLSAGNQNRPLIENAMSGDGDDELIGNDAKNVLDGGGGTNKLSGNRGDDLLLSHGTNDILDGGIGNDVLWNADSDGNTQYIFGKGYGSDLILDDPINEGNIKIYLKDLGPSQVKIFVPQYYVSTDLGPELETGMTYIEVLETGDRLFIPWIPRNEHRYEPEFAYHPGDAIKFQNGTEWHMQNIEDYAATKMMSESDYLAMDPVNNILMPAYINWLT